MTDKFEVENRDWGWAVTVAGERAYDISCEIAGVRVKSMAAMSEPDTVFSTPTEAMVWVFEALMRDKAEAGDRIPLTSRAWVSDNDYDSEYRAAGAAEAL